MLQLPINSRRPTGATPNAILCPFRISGAPAITTERTPAGGKGEPMVSGSKAVDIEGEPVEGAEVEVWQSSNEHFYDVQRKGVHLDWNLRSVFAAAQY